MSALSFRVGVVVALLFLGMSVAWSRPVTPLDLLTLRDVGDVIGDGLSISPNGRYVVYNVHQADAATNGYNSWWMLVNTSSGKSQRVVPQGSVNPWDYIGQWTAYAPVWAPDSSAFYYMKKRGGVESLHKLALTSDGGVKSDTVVALPPGNLTSLTWQNPHQADLTIEATTRTAIEAARKQSRNGMLLSFGYRTDLRGPRVGKYDPAKGPPDYSPTATSNDYALNLQTGSIQPQHVAALLHYNEDTIPVVKDLRTRYMFVESPDGTRVAYDAEVAPASNLGYTRYGVYVSPIAGGASVQFSPLSTFPIRQIAWSADAKRLYFLRSTDYMNSDMFVVDSSTKAVHQLTHSGMLLDGCSFATERPLVACTAETPTHPREVTLINLSSGSLKQLSDLNPEFNKLAKTKGELMVRTNKHGDTTFGYLTYPRGYVQGRRYPLIITLYRARGFQRGGVGDEYPIHVFAANGFFVLAYDVYNTTSYMPIALSQRQPLSITVLDELSPLDSITQMVGELSARGLVDQSRVGIGGLSHGTEVTLYAITHSHLFHAAISDGGSWDPLAYYFKDDLGTMIYTSWGLNGPPYSVNYNKWKMWAPSLNAANITAPLLMNAPDSEYLFALPMFWELKDRGKPVEMYVFPHETHVKMEPQHRLVIYNRNLDWYKYWLLDERDPDPAKVDQYRRWDQLRTQQHTHE